MKAQVLLPLVALTFSLSAHAACPPQAARFGLTILAHGYASDGAEPEGWLTEMATAIRNEGGGGMPIYTIRIKRDLTGGPVIDPTSDTIDITSVGSAVVKVDWSAADAGACPPLPSGLPAVPTWRIGDLVFTHLFATAPNGAYPIEIPIHLIGHSRGGSVMSRLARDLAGYGVWIDHMTTLDPHPLNCAIPQDDDWPVEAWSNVIFADNYYRTGNGGPDGQPVAGATNIALNGIVTSGFLSTGAHTDVHTYYHGTIEILRTLPFTVSGRTASAEWYDDSLTPYRPPRDETGFYFSAIRGGERPASGLHQNVSPGVGSRTSVTLAGATWPNIWMRNLPRYNYEAGERISFGWNYQDRDSDLNIEFFFDNDTNPFNNSGNPCVSSLATVTRNSNSSILSDSWNLDTTSAHVGTFYLLAKVSDMTGRVRYDYLRRPINIAAAVTSPNLTVLSVSGPSVTTAGASVAVSYTVKNVGTAPSGPFANRVSLATTPYGTAIRLANFTMASLAPNEQRNETRTVTIPLNIAANSYYLTVFADAFNEVHEPSPGENNNIGSTTPSQVTVTVPTYNIATSASPIAGGSTSGGGSYLAGTTVNVAATPAGGYSFVNWTEGGTAVSPNASYSFPASANRLLVANFTSGGGPYTLNVSAVNGSVALNPNLGSYPAGSQVTVAATPNGGYYFAGWSGDATGNANPLTLTINANKSINANFSVIAGPVLSVSVTTMDLGAGDGTGSGSFFVRNDGPGTLNWTATTGDPWITIQTPSGSIKGQGGQEWVNFSWPVNPSTTPRTGTITISAAGAGGSPKSVTLTQRGLPSYYTLTVNGQNGTVTRVPNQASYLEGTDVALTATPGDGYQFNSWSGDVGSAANPLIVTMTGNKNITANFIPIQPPIAPYEGKWALPLNTFNALTSAKTQEGGFIVFGNFSSTITVGGQPLTPTGGNVDIYAVKFDSSNQVVWVRQFGGANEESVSACAQHPAGGWVISGTFRTGASLGGVSLTSAGDRDAFIARLDESGNVVWGRRIGGATTDYGRRVAVDAAGNAVLFGVFIGSATVDGSGTTLNASGTVFDVFVTKYSSAGVFQWARSLGGSAYEDIYCGISDSTGNVYVGGIFEQQATFGSFVLQTVGSTFDRDGFLAKLDVNGTVLWAKRFGQITGNYSDDSVAFVGVAQDGTCFLAGKYEFAMLVDGQHLPAQSSIFGAGYVGKISAAGTLQWLRAIPASAASGVARGLITSDAGFLASGQYRGTMAFGSSMLTNNTDDTFLYFAKFDGAGTAQWAVSATSRGFGELSYFDTVAGGRIRFIAPVGIPVGLPGLDSITATAGDSVLVEIGPPEIQPRLDVRVNGNQLIFMWPTFSTGFVLEYATNLPAAIWTTNSMIPVAVGQNYTVTNIIGAGTKYFRLRK